MASTYIKMYRSLSDHELLAHDNKAFLVFTKLLLKVNWKTGTIRTGRHKLAAMTNLAPTTAWDALYRLQADSIVTLSSTSRYTDIHICKWKEYQGGSDSNSDSRPTTNRPQSDTINNNKRSKNNIYTSNSRKEEILKVLNEVMGKAFRTYPKDARARDTARLFTPDEVRKALERMKLDAWHKDKIRGFKAGYFLSSENIDMFLNYQTAVEAYMKQPKKEPSPKQNLMSRSEINKLEYQT